LFKPIWYLHQKAQERRNPQYIILHQLKNFKVILCIKFELVQNGVNNKLLGQHGPYQLYNAV
jgi:hypothetical protein